MSNFWSCGACGGWLKWFRPPHYKFFEDECKLHDDLYDLGGTEVERLEADRTFYFGLVRKSVGYFENRKVWALWWFVTLSYFYYLSVRVGARSRFNYHKNKTN